VKLLYLLRKAFLALLRDAAEEYIAGPVKEDHTGYAMDAVFLFLRIVRTGLAYIQLFKTYI